jgi:hypothetical protein
MLRFSRSGRDWAYNLRVPKENNITQMTQSNPYVQTLIEMGYDEQDCRNVAAAGDINVTYPRTIYGRTFATESEYNDAVADFINGL